MKELQGQFKTDFIKFWIDKRYGDLDEFISKPIEMQFGVVQSFGDSVGVYIAVDNYNGVCERYFEGSVDIIGFHYITELIFETRPEAQQEAITQFEKWYNENK